MPRPKKTTPTVIDPVTTYDITPAKLPEFAHPLPPPHMADDYLKAKVGIATTEPDTNLNPDRAQVAAVADLPHAPRIVVDSIPEGAPVTVARVMHEIPPGSGGPTLESILAAKDATIAEQSARIAELEAELVRVALESLTPAPALPPSPGDLIAGYRAVASGQVKAAEWKGRRLVRLHGNPEPIAMYDHPEPPPGCMPSGFVAEVASGTTRVMSPPLKDEAEARAWCEARCGWTVVA